RRVLFRSQHVGADGGVPGRPARPRLGRRLCATVSASAGAGQSGPSLCQVLSNDLRSPRTDSSKAPVSAFPAGRRFRGGRRKGGRTFGKAMAGTHSMPEVASHGRRRRDPARDGVPGSFPGWGSMTRPAVPGETFTLSLTIGGDAGQGVESSGALFTQALARGGWHVFGVPDYRSRIRGGHNF